MLLIVSIHPKCTTLGLLERYSTSRHNIKFYYNAAIAASYTLPDSFTLPAKDYIYRACASLIQKHPILSAIPVGEDTNETYFARLPEVDLDQPVSFQKRSSAFPGENEKDIELEELLNIQHNTLFPAPRPHWRLSVLLDAENKRRFTAAFVFHHGIADGTSAKAFHKTFLEAMHTASEPSKETKRVVPSPSTPLLPNLEAVHPMTISIPYMASVLFKHKIWSWRDPGLWTGSEIRMPSQTKMRHLVIPQSLATVFKQTCRQNNTTITAALQVIVARALFAQVPDTVSQVQCSGALSSRRWLPDIITDDSIGVWIQDYNESYMRHDILGDSFPWDEAKRSRKTIEGVLSLQGKNASPNMLKYINDFHQELFMSSIGQQRKATFEMSNVGFLSAGSDSSKPQVGRMLFSQSASVTGCATEVSVVMGGDGCLVLAFSWQKGVLDDDLVSSSMEFVEKELHGFAQ